MDVGLRSIVNQGERHSSRSSAGHLVSQVRNKIPTETRIAMVKILLSLRDKEPQEVFQTYRHTLPFQLMYTMVFTYQPEDQSEFKYAFILIDHATKSVYKVDSNENSAMANAAAFTQIAQGTHMYALNYPKTLEVQTGTDISGIAHLSKTALMLKLHVNKPKESEN